jgi:hypothetical protein
MSTSRLHLPASLRSPGVTRLQRYYGRSDSCSAAALPSRCRSVPSVVSALSGGVANGHQTLPRSVRWPPCPSRSPCVMACTFRPFRRQPPIVVRHVWSGFGTSAYRRPLLAGLALAGQCVIWASPLPSRLATTTGRIAFAHYGRVVHLPLLPTPPRGDAVTFGYEVQTNLGEDLHLADTNHLQAH